MARRNTENATPNVTRTAQDKIQEVANRAVRAAYRTIITKGPYDVMSLADAARVGAEDVVDAGLGTTKEGEAEVAYHAAFWAAVAQVVSDLAKTGKAIVPFEVSL